MKEKSLFKFRAWDYDEKRMHDVLVIDWVNRLVDFGNIEKPFRRVELMQSTGLKDKNGVEIYEGDVVNVTQYFGGHSFGQLPHVVRVSEYNNNLMLILQSKQRFIPEVSLNFSRSEDYEIIGNVHESPELMEETG